MTSGGLAVGTSWRAVFSVHYVGYFEHAGKASWPCAVDVLNDVQCYVILVHSVTMPT